MPLAPEIAALLEAMAADGVPQMHELPVAEARTLPDNLIPLGGEGADIASQRESVVGGVPAVVYTPHGEGPFPVFVWIHGGGWVICGTQHYHAQCQEIAAGAGCVVVSLDYRLAPEHKAPAAVDDVVAAIGWLLEHAGEFGGDPARIAVGGDSAGGNLSAVAAQHFGSRLTGQLLVYPATDMVTRWPSLDENGEGLFLTKPDMEHFMGLYLDGSGVDPADPRVSPMHAAPEVLAAVAPAFVITAEFDPLRDEGEAYAAKLAAAGVATKLVRYDGMIHVFYVMPVITPVARQAMSDSIEFLSGVFAAAPTGA